MAQSNPVADRVTANQDIEAPCSDVELVAAINRGDAAAFEVLYFATATGWSGSLIGSPGTAMRRWMCCRKPSCMS